MSNPFSWLSGLSALDRIIKEAKRSGNQLAAARERSDLETIFGKSWTREILEHVKNGADYQETFNSYLHRKKQQELQDNPPPLHGSAAWSSWRELIDEQILRDWEKNLETSDIFLSAFLNNDDKTRPLMENWLFWSGEAHLVTVAPSGSGKSLLQVIPNLLQYLGSCFVFDPKGELYEATSAWRNTIGKVYRIAPFETETDAFNPLDTVIDHDDARALANIIYPDQAVGDGAFFEREARSFLSAVIWFVARYGKGEGKTLRRVRRLTSSRETILELANDFAANHVGFPESIQEAGNVVKSMSRQGHSSLVRSLNEKLEIWSSDAVYKATCKSDFDFRDLKRNNVTVYLNVPLERLSAYAPFVRTILMLALDAMPAEKTRPKIPVLFLIDEFLRLGAFPAFVEALATHRDAGVRLWFFLQNLSTLRRLYPDSWESFFSETEVKCFFGVRDHFTAKLISDILEDETLAVPTTNTSQSTGADSSTLGSSEGTQFLGRRLLFPHEVEKFLGHVDKGGPLPGSRMSITMIGGTIRARTILNPWYFSPTYRNRFGRKGRWLIVSEYLSSFTEKIRIEAFNRKLPKLNDIGYQDYSLGRDGHIPHRDIMAMFDPDFNRVIIISAFAALERYLDSTLAPDIIDLPKAQSVVHDFFERLLTHEMLHQAVLFKTDDPDLGHEQEFLESAIEVFDQFGKFRGWNEPELKSVDGWPHVPDMALINGMIKHATVKQT